MVTKTFPEKLKRAASEMSTSVKDFQPRVSTMHRNCTFPTVLIRLSNYNNARWSTPATIVMLDGLLQQPYNARWSTSATIVMLDGLLQKLL